MKHPSIRHQSPKRKPKPLVQFKAHEYLARRAAHVQHSLDRLFGIEKVRSVGRA